MRRLALPKSVKQWCLRMLRDKLIKIGAKLVEGTEDILAALGAGKDTRTPAQWAFYAMGLAATVAVTVYVTRIARAALAGRV